MGTKTQGNGNPQFFQKMIHLKAFFRREENWQEIDEMPRMSERFRASQSV
jgi:hypothetical protein